MSATLQEGMKFVSECFRIFATMLKRDIWSEESLSMDREGWKCSGMRDYIASSLSTMT